MDVACWHFSTCGIALTMSVDWGKADLAHGRIGAFLLALLVAHEVEFYAFDCLVSGQRLNPQMPFVPR
jgi:hypothetical protein